MDTFKAPLRLILGPTQVSLSAAEEDYLHRLGHNVSSMKEGLATYIVWRRSNLQWLLVALTPLVLSLTGLTAVQKVNKVDPNGYDLPEFATHSQATLEYLDAGLPLVQALVLAFGNAYALWCWPCWWRSANGAMACYIFAVSMPFMIWLMPWIWLLDINESIAHSCTEVMETLQEALSLTQDERQRVPRCCRIAPGQLLGDGGRLGNCIKEGDLGQGDPLFRVFAIFVGIVSGLRPILMMFQVFLSMASTLFPSMLGMVFGQIKACLLVAELKSQSSLPPVLLVTIVASGTPLVAFLAVIPLAFAGTPSGSFGSVLLVLGFAVYLFRPTSMVAGSPEERAAALRLRTRAGIVLKLGGIVLLVVAVFTASHLRSYEEHLPALEELFKPLFLVTFFAKFLMIHTFATISMADMILFWNETATTALEQRDIITIPWPSRILRFLGFGK